MIAFNAVKITFVVIYLATLTWSKCGVPGRAPGAEYGIQYSASRESYDDGFQLTYSCPPSALIRDVLWRKCEGDTWTRIVSKCREFVFS
jgi:hypothetical protein